MQYYTGLSWVIGGAQGSGVDSVANILAKAYAQYGLYVYGKREYYSNIKGEHSYFTIRASSDSVHSHIDDIDILVTFDAETIFRHIDKVRENGIIVYDQNIVNTELNEVHTLDESTIKKVSHIIKNKEKPTIQDLLNYATEENIHLYGIPYSQILNQFSEKINNPAISRMARMINVISLSSSLAIIGFDLQILLSAINFIFKSKKSVAEINGSAAEFTYNYIKNNFQTFPQVEIKENKNKKNMNDVILVQGSQASALGKIVAGCRFQTYYPITPASDDSEFLESHQIIDQIDKNSGSILVVQTEDELSAICMAIGASLSGVRSSTATSGPGFSLMVEALGWAGINEVPLVVSLYQRAGPSTGLPTRHEQGDLLFAINSGHGEFPKIVYASGDIEESFYDTIKVFNFAEIYQLPVIHMLDKAIANSVMTCKMLDQNKILINRGKLLDTDQSFIKNGDQKYRRFQITPDGISPRATLGTSNGIFWNTGDEHNEEGHITEDPEIRIKMMDKRMQKLDIALQEISDDDKAVLYENSGNSEYTIISWGSTKGAIIDAMEILKEENLSINFIQIKLLHPFPKELLEKLLENTRVLIDIEMNHTSQLSKLIKQNLGCSVDYEIVKYNGRPMSSNEVYSALRNILKTRTTNRRIVLDNGA